MLQMVHEMLMLCHAVPGVPSSDVLHDNGSVLCSEAKRVVAHTGQPHDHPTGAELCTIQRVLA